MRVLIADQRGDVRAALRLLLEQTIGAWVVGEAAEVEMLLVQAGQVCPDLVLLDWGLPGLRIAALLPALRLVCPHAHVVALSGRSEVREEALNAGVSAFISKHEPPDRLLTTVRSLLFHDDVSSQKSGGKRELEGGYPPPNHPPPQIIEKIHDD